MSIENMVEEVDIIEEEAGSFEPISPNEVQKRTTVPVRFALGRSAGIHVVPPKAPKNLPEARQGALRYAKAH